MRPLAPIKEPTSIARYLAAAGEASEVGAEATLTANAGVGAGGSR